LALQEQWDEAMLEFQKALALTPEDPDANDGLLRILLFYKQDYLAALAQAQRMLSFSPDSMWLHLEIGLTYQGQGELAEAARWFEKAQLLYPSDETPPIYFAGNYLLRNMPAQAIESLKLSIRLNPNNPYPYERLADIYQQQGLRDQAIVALREAIRLAPGVADYHRRLADLYRDSEQFDLAMEEYKKVLDISPDDAYAQQELRKLTSR
jgi:tetratricopeptide (TPR) repeat protein